MILDNDSDPLPDEVSNSVIHQMGIVERFLLDIDRKRFLFDALIDGIKIRAGLG